MSNHRSARTTSKCLALGLVVSLTLLTAACAADEGSGDGYFDGKTITITLPFSPGGGTDTATRFIVDRAIPYLKGNVKVEYKNDESGGGIGGPNNWTIHDRHDGTSLLATTTTTVLPWLLGQEGVRYDFQQMTPLWGHPAGRLAYVNPKTGVQTAADIKTSKTPIVTGARTGAGAEITSIMAFEALGLSEHIKIVMGYEGGSEQVIAYEQNEINLNHQPTATYKRDHGDWEAEGKAKILFSHGAIDKNGKWVPDPIMPEVPTVHDVYLKMYGEEPHGDAWEAFSALTKLVNRSNYGLWVSSKAPEQARKELQEAFAAAIAAPDYATEAAKVIGPEKSIAGEDVEAFKKELSSYDLKNTSWITYTRNLLRTKYGAKGIGA